MGDARVLDVQRVEDLYRNYHHQILNFFLRKGLDEGTAEDLSHDVFLRVLRSGKEVDGDGYARNLLYRVAQNLLIDHFRKHNGAVKERLWPEAENPFPLDREQAHQVFDPEECCLSGEVSCDVRMAVAKLPPHYARALIMREYQGLSYREIAANLGLTEKAVESLLHRAKSQLRKELKGVRERGWWTALLIRLARWRDWFFSAKRSISRCFGWGGAAQVTGVAGVGSTIWNALTVCLLLCAIVGSGLLGIAAKTGREVSKEPDSSSPRIMDQKDGLTLVSRINEVKTPEYSGTRKVEHQGLKPGLALMESLNIPWREAVTDGEEILRAIQKVGDDVLGAALETVEIIWAHLLRLSTVISAVLGLPSEISLYSLPSARPLRNTLKEPARNIVEKCAKITESAENAVLENGSRAETSLLTLPSIVEGEKNAFPQQGITVDMSRAPLTMPSETLSNNPEVNTLDFYPQLAENIIGLMRYLAETAFSGSFPAPMPKETVP